MHGKGFREGFEVGEKGAYKQGTNEWRIWYFCNDCFERMYISPNSNSHKALIKYLKEHGWGHKECK